MKDDIDDSYFLNFTNTRIVKDDGGLWVSFSPNGKPKVRYRAHATFHLGRFGFLELELLGKDNKGKRLVSGRADWDLESLLIPHPLTPKKKPEICPTKHLQALLWALHTSPKINALVKRS